MPNLIPVIEPASIQAGILANHGRDHHWCVFLQFHFGVPPEKVRGWLQRFLPEIRSFRDQILQHRERRRDPAADGGVICNLFLSAEGFRKLGWEAALEDMDAAFVAGMKSARVRDRLNDPDYRTWAGPYRSTLDALVLLADDHPGRLADRLNALMNSLHGVGRVLFIETGETLRNENGRAIEHFGYADGISQPPLVQKTDDGLVAVQKEVFQHALDEHQGSYLVFRKLEQDVEEFYRKLEQMENHRDIPQELAGAQVIGRFRDGTPLVKSSKPLGGHPDVQIDFAKDPLGNRCPFHAHVRKVAPPKQDGPRIVRRGVPYGKRNRDLSDRPASGVGLLFMCYQRSIQEQFEVLQADWCNAHNFPEKDAGSDPLVGRPRGRSLQKWKKVWGGKGTAHFDFREINGEEPRPVVRMLGGEYFYAPSILYLKGLLNLPLEPQDAGQESLVAAPSTPARRARPRRRLPGRPYR